MSDKTTYIPLTELDKQSFQGPSQMLKAAVTYMDPDSGKVLAMLARLMELRQTMSLFNQEQLSICSLSGGSRPGIEEILKDIRKYCAPAEAEQIDQFLNILNAVKLYNQYSELTKNTDFANMMNQVNQMKNMNISPEQLQMLHTFLHAQSASSEKDAP
jgi:hypothetical protein